MAGRVRTPGVALVIGVIASCSAGEPQPEPLQRVASALTQEAAICGAQHKTSGLPWAPCAGLDTECAVGAWDPQSKCCHLVPRTKDVSCSAGACDGFGKCKAPTNPKDRDGDKILDAEDTLLGRVGWIRAYGGQPSFWHDIYAQDRVELRIDDEVVAVVPNSVQLDLSHVQLAVGPKPTERRAAFVSAPGDWAEIVLDAGDDFEVCLARDSQAGSELPASCQGQGLERIRCPAANESGIECSLEEGLLRIKAENLRYAWIPIDGEAQDIRLLMFPFFGPIELCPRCKDIPGHFPPPVLQIEVCNGEDDDGDGRVDEDGFATCDDNLACTLDRCNGSEGCSHTPRNSGRFCQAGPDCMELRCAEPFVAGANQDASEFPNANGCYQLLKHDFCNDTWDGCACNGAEQCDPWRAPSGRGPDPWAEFQGCISTTPRLNLPCEQLNGDGDACSTELCCEDWDPMGCRVHREIAARGSAAVDAYNTACDFPFGSGNGQVFCPDDPFRHAPGSYGIHCRDGNPCNQDNCVAPSGNCSHPALPDGEQPGCGGLVGKGCGSQECRAGACVQSARVPDPSDPFQCNGFAGADWPPFVAPTCLQNRCQGARCNLVPNAALCDNGLFCDGQETCSVANLTAQGVSLSAQSLPTPGMYWGCGSAATGPCDDGVGCTADTCVEASDSCSNTPRDYICHTSRGRAFDPCNPELRCQCSGPECGPTQADGCSTLATGYSPCNDGNICTTDTCKCADEFCLYPACSHADSCGIGGGGGIGGIGGLGGFGNVGNFGGALGGG